MKPTRAEGAPFGEMWIDEKTRRTLIRDVSDEIKAARERLWRLEDEKKCSGCRFGSVFDEKQTTCGRRGDWREQWGEKHLIIHPDMLVDCACFEGPRTCVVCNREEIAAEFRVRDFCPECDMKDG